MFMRFFILIFNFHLKNYAILNFEDFILVQKTLKYFD